MIKGSCLCEEIVYQYDGEFNEVALCHCKQCQIAQGGAFAMNAPIDAAKFKILNGQNLLKEFYSSPNKRRCFCEKCGSPIFSQRTDMPETIRLRLGTVREGNVPAPHYEIYTESKLEWIDNNGFDSRCALESFVKNKP